MFRFNGPLSVLEVTSHLSNGFISAVGHESTAQVLSSLLQQHVPMQRLTITMQPGDKAVVLKMRTRLPEGVVLDAMELAQLDFEFGLLERLE